MNYCLFILGKKMAPVSIKETEASSQYAINALTIIACFVPILSFCIKPLIANGLAKFQYILKSVIR